MKTYKIIYIGIFILYFVFYISTRTEDQDFKEFVNYLGIVLAIVANTFVIMCQA